MKRKILFLISLVISVIFWGILLWLPNAGRETTKMFLAGVFPLWIMIVYWLLVGAVVLGLAYGIYKKLIPRIEKENKKK